VAELPQAESSVNPIAAKLSEASLLLEDTAHPELADMLRIGAAEIERLHRIAHAYAPPVEYELHRLANRFLAWPLPDSVCSDLCVTDNKYHEKWKHKRSGTNLLSEDEAKQMLRYVLELK
jgi:hypothetical protein